MRIEQIYTACLSEASYFISSKGEAAVIDPIRDIEQYLALAEKQNSKIKYIFETHFHADFVSGHLDLAQKTGATIVYGPHTETKFSFHLAKDGEIFRIGNVTLVTIHTPGHTLESSCYLLKNEEDKSYAIFTGDTLFIGDVGRPDLSSGDGFSKENLAGLLYESLHNKIIPLPDELIVYPAHGAGSSCGVNIGKETRSTLGEQKKSNYALQPQTKEEFIKAITGRLTDAPAYFSINAKINKEGYAMLEEVKHKALTPLSITEFKQKSTEGCLILDTRKATEFTSGFIPGSVSIGLEGRFAGWAGSLLSFRDPIILVTDPGSEEDSVVRLSRVGLDNVKGYLKGGFESWKKAGEKMDIIIDIEPDELAMDLPFDKNLTVIDVRRPNEFEEGHVRGAVNLPLSEMADVAQIANIEDHQNLYIHCGKGYRSVIACSILKRHGYHNLRNVTGGWKEIKKLRSIPIEKDATIYN